MANLTVKEAFIYYNEKIQDYINTEDAKAIKNIVTDTTSGEIKFYKAEDTTGTADYTITVADLIKDKYLDLTKTGVVDDFEWSEAAYPNSTNPNLDGKPVVIWAVTNGDEIQYSFASLASLIDIYTGSSTSTATITVVNNEIAATVKVSETDGNIISAKSDGIYAAATDISAKADKLTSANADQILIDDGNGNLAGSGKTIADVESEAVASAKAYTDTKATKLETDITANANAISEINNASTGILATAKAYTDSVNSAMDTRVTALEADIITNDDIDAMFT